MFNLSASCEALVLIIMKSKTALLTACAALGICASSLAQAHIISDLFGPQALEIGSADSQGKEHKPARTIYPGRIIGNPPPYSGVSAFDYAWQYRFKTYELVFENATDLAAMIFSLAISAGDVSPDTPKAKFLKGVSGFHYSIDQILEWLNTKGQELSSDEQSLRDYLLKDKVIAKTGDVYVKSSAKIDHVLGCAKGKKRTYEQNLCHERLHVLWDLDFEFKQKFTAQFEDMALQEQMAIFKSMPQYNQDNLPQLLEEWAVGEAEKEPQVYLKAGTLF